MYDGIDLNAHTQQHSLVFFFKPKHCIKSTSILISMLCKCYNFICVCCIIIKMSIYKQFQSRLQWECVLIARIFLDVKLNVLSPDEETFFMHDGKCRSQWNWISEVFRLCCSTIDQLVQAVTSRPDQITFSHFQRFLLFLGHFWADLVWSGLSWLLLDKLNKNLLSELRV